MFRVMRRTSPPCHAHVRQGRNCYVTVNLCVRDQVRVRETTVCEPVNTRNRQYYSLVKSSFLLILILSLRVNKTSDCSINDCCIVYVPTRSLCDQSLRPSCFAWFSSQQCCHERPPHHHVALLCSCGIIHMPALCRSNQTNVIDPRERFRQH